MGGLDSLNDINLEVVKYYASDFPSWRKSTMIVGYFLGVPIKKGMAKEIGSVVPRCKGKEKKM